MSVPSVSQGGGGTKSKSALFDDEQIEGSTPQMLVNNKDIFAALATKSTDIQNRLSTSSSTVDRRVAATSVRITAPARSKIVSDNDDPLSKKMLDTYEQNSVRITKENLTIRKEDEARIVAALHNAARKQTTGSIYSVVVDLGKTGTLGIGVKDLADSILSVSMLKRENCCPGAGEDAGNVPTPFRR